MGDIALMVLGFLDPSRASRTIVVNANRFKRDYVFTISHRACLRWYHECVPNLTGIGVAYTPAWMVNCCQTQMQSRL